MVNYNTLQLTPTHCLDNYSRSATKTTLYYSVKRLSEIIFSILGVKQFPLPKSQLPSARKSYIKLLPHCMKRLRGKPLSRGQIRKDENGYMLD